MAVLLAAHGAKLRLYIDASGGSRLHDLLGQGNVLLERQLGAIDHHGGIPGADGVDTQPIAVSVVQMQDDGDGCELCLRAYHTVKQTCVGVGEGGGCGLKNDRCL